MLTGSLREGSENVSTAETQLESLKYITERWQDSHWSKEFLIRVIFGALEQRSDLPLLPW